MKKIKRTITVSICREKTATKSNFSLSLKTFSEIPQNKYVQHFKQVPLIFKQILAFALSNIGEIYPTITTNICIDFFIFLFVENFLN